MPAIAVTGTANGMSTPLSPSPGISNATAATKRKRASTEDAPTTNGTVEHEPSADSLGTLTTDPSLPEVLTDILAVLRNYDTTPSILNFGFESQAARSANSAEPNAKRTKLSQPTSSTISDKLKTAEYTNLESVIKDVDLAAAELLAPVKSKESNLPPTPYGRPSMLAKHESALLYGVIAFQKVLGDMVDAENRRTISKQPAKQPQEEPSINGVTVKLEMDIEGSLQKGGSVLTVFAKAGTQHGKQLFSSFQQPHHVYASGKSRSIDASVDAVGPLRESGIPNFISTSKIQAVETEDSKTSKDTAPKIGELFAPPAKLPFLQPPKSSKQMTTKGNTITFVPNDRPIRTERRNSYNWCTAKQTVGQWLGYGGVDIPLEPTSPQAKRKQRDRALSTGEAYIVPSESEKIALKKAQEDALFRKVYGSFAPSHDDSGVVVPEETKNEVWRNKVGERFAQRAPVVDPALFGEDDADVVVEGAMEVEDNEVKNAVESFDPGQLGLDKLKWESAEEKEVNDILQEISDLLETLSSYQRIRNSSLATSAKTPVAQNSALQGMIGSPSTPSSAEIEVYNTLKAQLSVLVLSLPPYAVARLNGEQLEKLNIKTGIIVETENARGVMAEDDAARQAKQQAFSAATGPNPQLTRAPSGSAYQNYTQGNQYNRTPVAPASVRSGAPQSYFPQQQSSNRGTPLQYNRSSSGVQTFSGGYPTTAARPSYNQQAYSQSTPRPGYQPSSNHYYSSLQQVAGGGRPSGYSQTNQQYQGTPQTQNRNYQQTPSSTYQRPQNSVPQYTYPTTQSPQIRTASPLTAASAAAPPPQYNASRQSYSTPANTSQTRSSYYQPPASQPGLYASSSGNVGGFQSTMSATERESMLSRIQQQQQRMAAPSASSGLSPARQSSGSGTPQPPQPSTNGSIVVQSS